MRILRKRLDMLSGHPANANHTNTVSAHTQFPKSYSMIVFLSFIFYHSADGDLSQAAGYDFMPRILQWQHT